MQKRAALDRQIYVKVGQIPQMYSLGAPDIGKWQKQAGPENVGLKTEQDIRIWEIYILIACTIAKAAAQITENGTSMPSRI